MIAPYYGLLGVGWLYRTVKVSAASGLYAEQDEDIVGIRLFSRI